MCILGDFGGKIDHGVGIMIRTGFALAKVCVLHSTCL